MADLVAAILLNAWAVHDEPYSAPELGRRYLTGVPTGHPTRGSDRRINTSHIANVSGRLVTTRSGSVYRLGDPSSEYLEWCGENGITIDPENPIADKRAATPTATRKRRGGVRG